MTRCCPVRGVRQRARHRAAGPVACARLTSDHAARPEAATGSGRRRPRRRRRTSTTSSTRRRSAGAHRGRVPAGRRRPAGDEGEAPVLAARRRASGRRWSCSTAPGAGRRRRSWPRRRTSTSGACGCARCPRSTRSGWASCPLSELERASLLFDIGEVHRVAATAGSSGSSTSPLGLVGLVPLLVGAAGRRWSATSSATAGRCSTARSGWARAASAFVLIKFRTMVPDGPCAARGPTRGRPPDHPFGAFLRRTHLDELPQVLEHPRGRPRRSSGPGPSSRTTSRSSRRSCPSTTCATSCGPGSPAGPR